MKKTMKVFDDRGPEDKMIETLLFRKAVLNGKQQIHAVNDGFTIVPGDLGSVAGFWLRKSGGDVRPRDANPRFVPATNVVEAIMAAPPPKPELETGGDLTSAVVEGTPPPKGKGKDASSDHPTA